MSHGSPVYIQLLFEMIHLVFNLILAACEVLKHEQCLCLDG